MRIRVALALSLVVPALVAWIAVGVDPGLAPGLASGAWWIPAAGASVALGWLVALRRSVVLMLVAAGLTALGAQASAKARSMFQVSSASGEATTAGELPFFDLRAGGIPEPVPPFVRVQGFVRPGWTLDEYAVEPGGLPDQSAAPIAVLIPVVGSPALDGDAAGTGSPLEPGVAVVIARVAPSTAFDGREPTSLRGKTEPLDPELLTTLVQVQGDPTQLRGVLVDTLAIPSRKDAWLEFGLGFIALVVAMACGFVAAGPRPKAHD